MVIKVPIPAGPLWQPDGEGHDDGRERQDRPNCRPPGRVAVYYGFGELGQRLPKPEHGLECKQASEVPISIPAQQ